MKWMRCQWWSKMRITMEFSSFWSTWETESSFRLCSLILNGKSTQPLLVLTWFTHQSSTSLNQQELRQFTPRTTMPHFTKLQLKDWWCLNSESIGVLLVRLQWKPKSPLFPRVCSSLEISPSTMRPSAVRWQMITWSSKVSKSILSSKAT